MLTTNDQINLRIVDLYHFFILDKNLDTRWSGRIESRENTAEEILAKSLKYRKLFHISLPDAGHLSLTYPLNSGNLLETYETWCQNWKLSWKEERKPPQLQPDRLVQCSGRCPRPLFPAFLFFGLHFLSYSIVFDFHPVSSLICCALEVQLELLTCTFYSLALPDSFWPWAVWSFDNVWATGRFQKS